VKKGIGNSSQLLVQIVSQKNIKMVRLIFVDKGFEGCASFVLISVLHIAKAREFEELPKVVIF